mgnify:FL=1|jgi:lysophospholipase L1-like esterase
MLPVSAVQGLWLRRVARRLPGAPGERQGFTGGGTDFHLLAIGDSIIDGVGIDRVENALPVRFAHALAEETGQNVHWRVEGESGFGILDVIERLDSLPEDLKVDLVLVSVGVNDVTGLSRTRYWKDMLEKFLQQLRDRWPTAVVLFAGLPPMSLFPLPPQPLRFSLGLRALTLDRIAADVLSGSPGTLHVPTEIRPGVHGFCEDGFHPDAESCNLWAKQLAVIASRRNKA